MYTYQNIKELQMYEINNLKITTYTDSKEKLDKIEYYTDKKSTT